MANETYVERGLECLSDETLATIVEADVRENGGLKSGEAYEAFAELSRRSAQ
jgi:hypothetical protein